MKRKLAVVAGMVLGAVLVLGGCSGGGGEATSGVPLADQARGEKAPAATDERAGGSGNSSGAAKPGEVAKPGEEVQPGSTAGTDAKTGSVPGQPSLARQIVRTGSLTVETAEVERKRQEAVGIVTGMQGHVASEDSGSGEDGKTTRANLVLRVPTASFESAIQRLSGLGKRVRIQQDSSDVTEQVVDVESRIATQRASLNRMRTLLSKATTIQEIVSVESELTRREADLESLLAKQKSLGQQTELATLTLLLTEPGKTPVEEKEDDRGFLAGLRGGWDAFTIAFVGLATALGAVLPFLILLALLGIPVYRLRHRFRRGPAAPATAPAPAASEQS